jgi:hypothetical protein
VDYLLLEGGKARGIHDFPVKEDSEFSVFAKRRGRNCTGKRELES